jgi:small subunit ribosomal protein S10e
MFVTKKNRLAVYSYLFKEGTIVVKKDMYQEKHSDYLEIPNLEVMKLMRSFTSKGYVKETFNWQWYYYYLTEEGINYLRQYLGLPEDIVPATLKAPAVQPRPSRPEGGRRGYDDDKMKGTGPGGDFKPRFDRGNREGYRGRGERA